MGKSLLHRLTPISTDEELVAAVVASHGPTVHLLDGEHTAVADEAADHTGAKLVGCAVQTATWDLTITAGKIKMTLRQKAKKLWEGERPGRRDSKFSNTSTPCRFTWIIKDLVCFSLYRGVSDCK